MYKLTVSRVCFCAFTAQFMSDLFKTTLLVLPLGGSFLCLVSALLPQSTAIQANACVIVPGPFLAFFDLMLNITKA